MLQRSYWLDWPNSQGKIVLMCACKTSFFSRTFLDWVKRRERQNWVVTIGGGGPVLKHGSAAAGSLLLGCSTVLETGKNHLKCLHAKKIKMSSVWRWRNRIRELALSWWWWGHSQATSSERTRRTPSCCYHGILLVFWKLPFSNQLQDCPSWCI